MKNNKVFKLFICFMCIMCITSSCFCASYMYKRTTKTKTDESSVSTVQTVATPEFTFQSGAQILIDPYSGTVLYENNADEHLLPASVTKVMTLLLLMEQIDSGAITYSDKITCSQNAADMGGSQIWFKPGETLTVDECLKSICVVSANDVTMAVAEHIGGTETNFVKMMNDKATELGMNNTCFRNCHGIDEDGHYTCARDIAIMSAELITKHPNILNYSSIWMDTLRNGEFGLSNTNKLIRYYEGATGLKTGYTSTAGYNLSATATRNGSTFLAVIMKAPSSDIRNKEASELLNYAFSTYETKKIYETDYTVDKLTLNKCLDNEAIIKTKKQISMLVNKGGKVETEEIISYNQELKAPISAGTVVGKIEIINKENGEKIGESELYVQNDMNKSTFLDYFKKLFELYIMKPII